MKEKIGFISFKIFSAKTLFEVLAGIWINLTSAWFGIILVSPGLFGVSSFSEYNKLLSANIPFGIMGLFIALWLTERSKKL